MTATRQDRGPRRRWSYAEFARLPSDDGNRYEVIAGELHVTPSPRPLHQTIVARLDRLLGGFVERHGLGWVAPGPIDVLFAEGDYLAPDLVFVRRERMGIVSERGLERAPDLVVEVLSGSTAGRDRGIKRERYARYGVPEYWVVDPKARRIEVCRQGEGPDRSKADSDHTAAGDGRTAGYLEGPDIVEDVLTWRPGPDGPELEIPVPHLMRSIDR
ncbi:MAG: Uma2 family endonuclease [Gemmatimonadota bacterium]